MITATVTENLLPPETTTPMPPQLHHIYTKELGWPGHLDQHPPAAMPPRPVVMPRRRWPLFITKMSAHTPRLEL